MRVSLLVFVLIVLAGPAVAGTSDGVVLESYVGPKPASAAAAVTPLLNELAQRRYSIDQDVSRRYEAGVSHEVGTVTLPSSFAADVDRGTKLWASGQFSDAVAVLSPLIETSHAASGSLIGNKKARDKLQDALVVLWMSYDRAGDRLSAENTLGELLRTFANPTVNSAFGQGAATAFAQAQKAALAAPKGKLVVQVANQASEVYINEQLASTGTTARDVLPGTYRVIVQQGSLRSRTHEVEIKAGSNVVIEIDPEFDQLLRTAPFMGFEFIGAAQRERLEGPFAALVAEALAESSAVIVGIDATPASGPVLYGALILRNGREVRRARVALTPAPSAERLSDLAGFLVGDKKANTAGLEIQLDGVVPAGPGPGPGPSEGRSTRWGGWPWVTGVLAVGGLTAGGILLALDGHCKDGSNDPRCPDVYENKPPGWGSLGAGAVFTGITVYLIITRPPSAPRRSAFVAPAGNGGAIAGITGTW